MKLDTQIVPKGFYAFSGRSNANSCFIERISDSKHFLIYANYFLRGYLTIQDYIINQDGWIIIVKIKSQKKIIEASKVIDSEPDISKIISERMRLLLSTFVRVTNRRKGRTGCLVHSSFEKKVFSNLEEALSLINKIRNQHIKIYNGKKKYRGLKTHYKVSEKLGKGSVFLCSKDIRKKKKGFSQLGEVIGYKGLSNLVVEELIKFTLKQQTLRKNTKYNTFFSKNSS